MFCKKERGDCFCCSRTEKSRYEQNCRKEIKISIAPRNLFVAFFKNNIESCTSKTEGKMEKTAPRMIIRCRTHLQLFMEEVFGAYTIIFIFNLKILTFSRDWIGPKNWKPYTGEQKINAFYDIWDLCFLIHAYNHQRFWGHELCLLQPFFPYFFTFKKVTKN